MSAHSKTQLLRIVRNLNQQLRNNSITSTKGQQKTTTQYATRHFEEIQIPVPWGHIAGKWYGSKHERPIVGLHGWQDNAGTFDTMAPFLPANMAFVALDMPGHGMSSWLPEGIPYRFFDYVALIRRLMEVFKWDKISIIGHSMSSINSFAFAAMFPDKVDLLIGLDILKPLTKSASNVIDHYAEHLEGHFKVERRMRDKTEPPCYEWNELVERLHSASNKSIDMDACKFVLQRNIKPSEHEPHKYYFSRDSRLKTILFYAFSQEVPVEMARRINCPYLFIKALQAPYYERKEYYDEVLKILKQNPKFEYHEVEGSHHVHLNEPEKVTKVVNSFINKWKS